MISDPRLIVITVGSLILDERKELSLALLEM